MTLQTFDGRGQPIIYGHAAQVFQRWDIYDEPPKGGDVLGATRLAKMSAGRVGNTERLRLPQLQCEHLIQEWPLWFASLEPMCENMRDIITQISADDGELLPQAYRIYAASIWQMLKSNGIVRCSPFRTHNLSLRDYIFPHAKPMEFHGVILLLGEHNSLWHEILLEEKGV